MNKLPNPIPKYWAPQRSILEFHSERVILRHQWQWLYPLPQTHSLGRFFLGLFGVEPKSTPPKTTWLLRIEKSDAYIQICESKKESRSQLDTEGLTSIKIPKSKITIKQGRHRALPWSDLYEVDDGEFDNGSLALEIKSDSPLLSGSWDLMSDISADSGYGHSKDHPVLIERYDMIQNILTHKTMG